MHDGSGVHSNFFDRSQWCCYHPKVKDNWKTVLAAVVLLIVGTGTSSIYYVRWWSVEVENVKVCVWFTGLLLIGLMFVLSPDPNLQGIVFIIAGLICFIPGSYHVVYIYFAVIGKDGYDFYHLPLFNWYSRSELHRVCLLCHLVYELYRLSSPVNRSACSLCVERTEVKTNENRLI